MKNDTYPVEILVNNHKVKQYEFEGRTYIEAKENSEYEIKIKNNSCNRILVVGSVDGLNILSGETANETDNGYVVNGNDNLYLKGFRYSEKEVGTFKFSKKDKSYAAEKGNSRNCGVIGIRIFSEKVLIPTFLNTIIYNEPVKPKKYPYDDGYTSWPKYWCGDSGLTWGGLGGHTSDLVGGMGHCSISSYSCNVNCSNTSENIQKSLDSDVTFDVGTTWGGLKNDPITYTNFEKGGLVYSLDIFYASRAELEKIGINFKQETKISYPESFSGKFCKPPKNFRIS